MVSIDKTVPSALFQETQECKKGRLFQTVAVEPKQALGAALPYHWKICPMMEKSNSSEVTFYMIEVRIDSESLQSSKPKGGSNYMLHAGTCFKPELRRMMFRVLV